MARKNKAELARAIAREKFLPEVSAFHDRIKRRPITVTISTGARIRVYGGWESANVIRLGVDLANGKGETTISIRDFQDRQHTVNLEDALLIAATVGKEYQRLFDLERQARWDLRSITDVDQIASIISNYKRATRPV